MRALKPTDITPDQQRITFAKIELISGTLADASVREGATLGLASVKAKAKSRGKGKGKGKYRGGDAGDVD